MQVAVDIIKDMPISVLLDKDIEEKRKNCYLINLDDNFNRKKMIKKGYWKQQIDDKGNLCWKGESVLQPVMGYFVENKEIKIDMVNYPDVWTIKEILEEKYEKKLENVSNKYSSIYYEEFIDNEVWKNVKYQELNTGKKVCFGNGIIEHDFELVDNKIYFDCEYTGELPHIELSLDGKKFLKVDSLPFSNDFRKKKYKKIYLKINDLKNMLTAYHICFNSETMAQIDFIGRGMI